MGCVGQRYEVWTRTIHSNNYIRGNYGFSNDSVLMTFSNPSLFIPSKDIHFSWDDVANLKVRNKSRNQTGQLIGAGLGSLAVYMFYNSMKNSPDAGPAEGIFFLIAIPAFPLTGLLAGHLATSKKTDISIHGLNSKDKDQLIKKTIKK